MFFKLLSKDGRDMNESDNCVQWPMPSKRDDGTWIASDWTPIVKLSHHKAYELLNDIDGVLAYPGDTLWIARIRPNAERTFGSSEYSIKVSSCRLVSQVEKYHPGLVQQWCQVFVDQAKGCTSEATDLLGRSSHWMTQDERKLFDDIKLDYDMATKHLQQLQNCKLVHYNQLRISICAMAAAGHLEMLKSLMSGSRIIGAFNRGVRVEAQKQHDLFCNDLGL